MGGYVRNTCYAFSEDGLRWEKPALDVQPGTNVVHTTKRDSTTIWLDLDDPDLRRRLSVLYAHPEGAGALSLYFSPDGIHWSDLVARSGPTGDRTTVFYNPFRKVWVYSLRGGDAKLGRIRRYRENRDVLEGANNCPVAPNSDQRDGDHDGFGDACDHCPAQNGDADGCPCTLAGCDDGNACTIDACVDGVGCQHSAPVSFDAVTCRLSILSNTVADAPAATFYPRLAHPGSGLVRALARATRLVKGAATALRHQRLKRVENRIVAIQGALGQFTRRVDRARDHDRASRSALQAAPRSPRGGTP